MKFAICENSQSVNMCARRGNAMVPRKTRSKVNLRRGFFAPCQFDSASTATYLLAVLLREERKSCPSRRRRSPASHLGNQAAESDAGRVYRPGGRTGRNQRGQGRDQAVRHPTAGSKAPDRGATSLTWNAQLSPRVWLNVLGRHSFPLLPAEESAQVGPHAVLAFLRSTATACVGTNGTRPLVQ